MGVRERAGKEASKQASSLTDTILGTPVYASPSSYFRLRLLLFSLLILSSTASEATDEGQKNWFVHSFALLLLLRENVDLLMTSTKSVTERGSGAFLWTWLRERARERARGKLL